MKKAVLVTDGPSNRDSYLTLPNAQQLKNIPAQITAVGVGSNVDQNELQVSEIYSRLNRIDISPEMHLKNFL